MEVSSPVCVELELSFLLVRELRDRACHCIRAGGAVGEAMLVQPVADGDKCAFAKVRAFGLEVQDDIQGSVHRDGGIDGFYAEGRLTAVVGFTTACYCQEEG